MYPFCSQSSYLKMLSLEHLSISGVAIFQYLVSFPGPPHNRTSACFFHCNLASPRFSTCKGTVCFFLNTPDITHFSNQYQISANISPHLSHITNSRNTFILLLAQYSSINCKILDFWSHTVPDIKKGFVGFYL